MQLKGMKREKDEEQEKWRGNIEEGNEGGRRREEGDEQHEFENEQNGRTQIRDEGRYQLDEVKGVDERRSGGGLRLRVKSKCR